MPMYSVITELIIGYALPGRPVGGSRYLVMRVGVVF
jgi:hypothetical protein